MLLLFYRGPLCIRYCFCFLNVAIGYANNITDFLALPLSAFCTAAAVFAIFGSTTGSDDFLVEVKETT